MPSVHHPICKQAKPMRTPKPGFFTKGVAENPRQPESQASAPEIEFAWATNRSSRIRHERNFLRGSARRPRNRAVQKIEEDIASTGPGEVSDAVDERRTHADVDALVRRQKIRGEHDGAPTGYARTEALPQTRRPYALLLRIARCDHRRRLGTRRLETAVDLAMQGFDLGDVLRAFSGVARRSGGGNRLPRSTVEQMCSLEIERDVERSIRLRRHPDRHLHGERKRADSADHERMRSQRLHVLYDHADGRPSRRSVVDDMVGSQTQHHRLADAPRIRRLARFRQCQH